MLSFLLFHAVEESNIYAEVNESTVTFKGSGTLNATYAANFNNNSYDSFILEAGITGLEENAFSQFAYLVEVKMSSVEEIGSKCFESCTVLESVELSPCLRIIADHAFFDCDALKSIEIPNSVKEIGENAFYSCSVLENIDIPNSVERIGLRAFYSCTSLKSVKISNQIETLDEKTFDSCTALTSVVFAENSKLKEIKDGVFYNCEFDTISLPDSLEKIGKDAFSNCPLRLITLPKHLTYIGEEAFLSTKLINLTVPNSVKIIKERAFSSCDSLETVIIGSGIKTIEDLAFTFNTNLTHFACFGHPNISDTIFDHCDVLKYVCLANATSSTFGGKPVEDVSCENCSFAVKPDEGGGGDDSHSKSNKKVIEIVLFSGIGLVSVIIVVLIIVIIVKKRKANPPQPPLSVLNSSQLESLRYT